MKSAVFRNMKVFIQNWFGVLLLLAVLLVIFVTVYVLQGGSVKSISLGDVYFVLLFIIVFSMMYVGMGVQVGYKNTVFAMPTRRIDFLYAKYLFSGILIVLYLAVFAGIVYFSSFEWSKLYLAAVSLEMSLFFSVIMGIIIEKYGKTGYLFMCGCAGFIGGLIGALSEEMLEWTQNMESWIYVLVAVVFLIFLACAIVADKKSSQIYEVK